MCDVQRVPLRSIARTEYPKLQQFQDRNRDSLMVQNLLALIIRFGASRGVRAANRGRERLHNDLGVKLELIENTSAEQRLAPKGRSRRRVVCATPLQKRLQW